MFEENYPYELDVEYSSKQRAFLRNLEEMFDEGKDTDLEIRVEQRYKYSTEAEEREDDVLSYEPNVSALFNVHEAFIRSRFPSLWKELEYLEEGVLNIYQFRAETVWRFLKWCYLGNYPSRPEDSYNPERKGQLKVDGHKVHLRMYALAKRWPLPELKNKVLQKFRVYWDKPVGEDWKTILRESLLAAFRHEQTADKKLQDLMVEVGLRYHLVFLERDKVDECDENGHADHNNEDGNEDESEDEKDEDEDDIVKDDEEGGDYDDSPNLQRSYKQLLVNLPEYTIALHRALPDYDSDSNISDFYS